MMKIFRNDSVHCHYNYPAVLIKTLWKPHFFQWNLHFKIDENHWFKFSSMFQLLIFVLLFMFTFNSTSISVDTENLQYFLQLFFSVINVRFDFSNYKLNELKEENFLHKNELILIDNDVNVRINTRTKSLDIETYWVELD